MDAVVSFAVERLGDLLIQEANFLRGVTDRVEGIKTELERIQGALKDADSRQDESEIFHSWVKGIREAAYDAEDVIETFAFEVAMKRRRGLRTILKRYSCIFCELKSLRKVGTEIDAIKTRISAVNTSLQSYGSNRSAGDGEGSSARNERRTYSHIVEEDTVGVEESVKTLVEHLVGKEWSVISIWGMGGLGKTTLAKRVYRDGDVKRHFDRIAWCSISQQFNVRAVLREILTKLKSASKEEPEKTSEADLFEQVHEIQVKEKCLVILDDVWRREDWKKLRPAFPLRNGVSKIMITSRNQQVGLDADPGAFLYKPKLLSEKESWELLRTKAFPKTAHATTDVTINKEVEELGKKMVKRCGGLPLAVVLLGGVLATKPTTLYEWESVDRNLKSYLGKGEAEGVSNVLALSYQDLPYHLKPCFLYLSLFPEDYEIRAKTLVQMWMAEGIVSSISCEEVKTLEDVGEECLGQLIRRCILQVEAKRWNGRVKTCRMHDLMRDLCLSKAKEENFVETITPPQLEADSSSMATATTAHKVRRCAIYLDEGVPLWSYRFDDEEIFNYLKEAGNKHDNFHLMNAAHTRSFLIFPYALGDVHWMMGKLDFKDFKLLRVLNLEGLVLVKKALTTIAELIHLKFLSFKYGRLLCFPPFLRNLKYIQTLDLGIFDSSSLITRSIIHDLSYGMKWLRYLSLPQPSIWGEDNGEVLENLETMQWDISRNLEILKNFDGRCLAVKDLAKLTKLRKLSIHDLKNFKELETIFNPSCPISNTLHSFSFKGVSTQMEEADLEHLSACKHLYKLELAGVISNLPSSNHFPPNLTKLILGASGLKQDPMPILERLINLSILYLVDVYDGEEMVLSTNGFPQLIVLGIYGAANLKRLRVDKGAMPRLKTLKIRVCSELEMIPEGLKYITTLKELEIWRMPRRFVKRLQVINGEEGEDFYKVQHVTSISFRDIREERVDDLHEA